jgi:hypothetical protein
MIHTSKTQSQSVSHQLVRKFPVLLQLCIRRKELNYELNFRIGHTYSFTISEVTPSIKISRVSPVPSKSGFSLDTTSTNDKGGVAVGLGDSNEGWGVGRAVRLGSLAARPEA